MTNPFDRDDAPFRVVVNELGQHSLWPEFADVPGGWVAVHGPAARQDCLDYVDEHWPDITPVLDRELVAS
jgi:MbtH protein